MFSFVPQSSLLTAKCVNFVVTRDGFLLLKLSYYCNFFDYSSALQTVVDCTISRIYNKA